MGFAFEAVGEVEGEGDYYEGTEDYCLDWGSTGEELGEDEFEYDYKGGEHSEKG